MAEAMSFGVASILFSAGLGLQKRTELVMMEESTINHNTSELYCCHFELSHAFAGFAVMPQFFFIIKNTLKA